jgi:hypothetical protein
VLIIAPPGSGGRESELSSRVMLSKNALREMNGSLSLLIFPHLTNEAIDLRPSVDYWSERDSNHIRRAQISSDPIQ